METKYVLTTKIIYGIDIIGNRENVATPIFVHGKTKKEINNFIKLCNQEKLEPVHLRDVICDLLYD